MKRCKGSHYVEHYFLGLESNISCSYSEPDSSTARENAFKTLLNHPKMKKITITFKNYCILLGEFQNFKFILKVFCSSFYKKKLHKIIWLRSGGYVEAFHLYSNKCCHKYIQELILCIVSNLTLSECQTAMIIGSTFIAVCPQGNIIVRLRWLSFSTEHQ